MKKRYLLIAFLITVIGFIAVIASILISRNDHRSEVDQYVYCDDLQGGVFYEDSVLYLGSYGILHLIDVDSGRDVVYCNKPNCTHERYSHLNQNPSCPAVFYGLQYSGPVLYGEHLYFIGNMTNEDLFVTQYLYEMDENGENRRKAAALKEVQNVRTVIYSDGYVCGAYFNRIEVNDKGEIVNENKPCAGIFVIDLETYDVYMGEQVTGEQANITRIYYDNDAVYYCGVRFRDDITEDMIADNFENDFETFIYDNVLYDIYRYDIKTKETSLIKELDHIYGAQMLDGDIYYTSKDGYFVLDKQTAEITELDAVERMVPEDKMLFGKFDKIGDELYFSYSDADNMVVYCRVEGTDITELLKVPEAFIINSFCGSSIYVSYYDDEGRFCLGIMDMEDFNKGVYHPRRLRYYNEDEEE